MQPESVQAILAEGMPCQHVAVEGDGHHFYATIVSAEFVAKSRVQRQQRVLAVVGSKMESNEIHALSMKCYTPDEWEQLHG
jgi:acid stress-induced BolA-like protein IbaG/YrbA